MFKIFRRFTSNKTHPTSTKPYCYDHIAFPHYNATIIKLGWLGSPRYRKLLKKKLKKRRKRDYKHYAAITIQHAWFKSSKYRKLYIAKINTLLTRVEKLDIRYVDEYIKGIERLIL